MIRRVRRGCARLLALLLLGLVGWGVWVGLTWPDVAALVRQSPASTAFIDRWQKHQRQRNAADVPAWTWVPYARISPALKRAVLVGEDLGFFGHRGFAGAEIRKSLADAWAERQFPRGASTITQQVAKNLWLSPSPNPLRKLREALLARQLERHLGKRRILEIYLNIAEFGPGVYGAEAAAQRYFHKPAADLTWEEAARLAAGLPRPSTWHPGATSRTYQRRVQRLLHRMSQTDFLARQI